ncbi:hypothetical protein Fmac_030350 [Flemingia macrophylla]|uniref:Uncharacterized protein n=1 Tax=Flemingia macrophylla TaxID=520843 RepID=A0ABD1LD36_9FABA
MLINDNSNLLFCEISIIVKVVGIIKRKALIKDLAAIYHAECLAYCQELLELQAKWEEPFIDVKTPEESKKETARPSKRMKKLR